VAAVFRFEQADSPATMEGLISFLIDWLADRPDLRRMFSLWIRATLMRKPNYGIYTATRLNKLTRQNQGKEKY
jgi:hypothetical protein